MKPSKIAKTFVCSACGLDWEKHPEKPTLEDCVELLKATLVKRPASHEITSVYPSNMLTWKTTGFGKQEAA